MTTVADIFPGKYLAANDLKGKDYTLTINKIDIDIFTDHGGNDVRKPVLYFKEAEKGFVLNKSNANAIAEIHGNTIENWVGKRITIGTAWIEAFGKQTEALRVRPALRDNAPLPTAEEMATPEIKTMEQYDEDLDDKIPF